MESREDEINLYLKVIKTIALKVKRSERIKNIKAMLRNKEGISENLQELFLTGERLQDDKKLVDYGIQMNSTLHLFLQGSVAIKLLVNMPSNQKIIAVEAKTSDTIQNIKFLINAKEGIQSDKYTLIYAGKLLEDNMTLASLKIQGESTLHLVFNPRDLLSVSVEMPSGEIMKPEVKVMHTVGDVKDIIGSMVCFPVNEWNLINAGMQLEDSKTLAFYNITEECILKMLPPTIEIFARQSSGATITLEVRRQDTVKDVKEKIFEKLGLPVHVQNLVFAGKRLEDGRNLASYHFRKGNTLNIISSWPNTFYKMKLSEIGDFSTGLLDTTTIGDLKALVRKKVKKPVKEAFLGGKALKDQVSLADNAIEKDTELVFALEVRKAILVSSWLVK